MSISQPLVTHLDRDGGRIAYTVTGRGPLVIAIPGMGDLRASYRHLVPALTAAGFRVATLDLRGHGDSDATFTRYDDEAAADDAIALAEQLGEPALLVGNSMGAGAAVIAAAHRPELVTGLVLVGPFVRNPPVNRASALLLRVLMAPAWCRWVWAAYLPSLYAGTKPADFDDYRASVAAAMRRPGHARAFSATTRTSHAPAEAALDDVESPALVVMGDRDPTSATPPPRPPGSAIDCTPRCSWCRRRATTRTRSGPTSSPPRSWPSPSG